MVFHPIPSVFFLFLKNEDISRNKFNKQFLTITGFNKANVFLMQHKTYLLRIESLKV